MRWNVLRLLVLISSLFVHIVYIPLCTTVQVCILAQHGKRCILWTFTNPAGGQSWQVTYTFICASIKAARHCATGFYVFTGFASHMSGTCHPIYLLSQQKWVKGPSGWNFPHFSPPQRKPDVCSWAVPFLSLPPLVPPSSTLCSPLP